MKVFIFALLSTLLFHNAYAAGTFRVGVVRDLFLRYAWMDNTVYQGVKYWAEYTNSKGGLVYGNEARQIEVVTLDASSVDSASMVSNVYNRYRSMILDYGCELVVSPYGSSRSLSAVNASDSLNVVNLLYNTGFQALPTLTMPWKNVFSWGHKAPSSGVEAANLLGKKGAKTYVMLCTSERGAQPFCAGVKPTFEAAGMKEIRYAVANVSTVDSADFINNMVPAIRSILEGVEVDVFVCSFLPDQFQGVLTAFEAVKPNVKASVILSPIWQNIQKTPTDMGAVGNGWISITPVPQTIEIGKADAYGGSSLEFVDNYVTAFNGQYPTPYSALALAMLNTYTIAVKKSGTVNNTIVTQTMIDLEPVYTVAGMLKYDVNHTNVYSQWFPLQFRDGEGIALQTEADLTYPAEYPWRTKGMNIKLIIGIAVPIGVVVLAAVLIGIIYIRHQRHAVVQALVKTEEGERRNYKIDFSAIEIQTLLGSGSFGHVYRGEYRGTQVAIKKLKHQNLTKKQLDEFAGESSVMVGLRHPNIVLFMGVCLEPANLCIITELMSRGSLYDVLNNQEIDLSFSVKIKIALDTLRGLQFVHSAGFLHRDLKSPNLLVDKSWNIKLADFGLTVGKGHAASNAQVSLLWTAPEVLEHENDSYTEKSDIYSFAVILWEIMARKLPWDGVAPAAIHTAVVAGKRPIIDPNWGDQVCKAISSGWDNKINNRPSIKELRVMLESIPINDNELPVTNTNSSSSSQYREQHPTPPCTMVFCEVENEHKLWQHDPHVAMKTLKKYYEVLRTQSRRLAGYEMPTDTSTMVFVFHEAVAAVNFCMRVQNDLLQNVWPQALDDVPFIETEDGVDGVLYKGIRACMGVHYGASVITRDDDDKAIYSGAIVDEGNLLVHCANGGQILLSGEAYGLISSEKRLDPFFVENLASLNFPKRKDQIVLYEIVPKQLKGRLGSRSDYLEQLQFGATPPGPPQMMSKWVIPYDEMTIQTLIGTGLTGEVFRGTYNGKLVAIKKFSKQKLKEHTILEMKAESAKLFSIDNEHITKFIGMCTKGAHICLVTELMEKGDLANILSKHNELPWSQKMKIVIDIAEGLQHLHSLNLIHRDIKSRNIFVGADMKAKIGDLGFTVIKAANQTMTQVGTVAWTGPEIFEGSHYTEKADIYGFAIVMWELVFQKKPWEGTHTMKVINNVLAGKRLPLNDAPHSTPTVILDLISQCWKQVPEERLSATQILEKLRATEY